MNHRRHFLILACLLQATPAFALGPNAPFEPPRAAPAPALAASASSTGSGPLPGSVASDGLTGVRLAAADTAALIDGRWWPLGSAPRGARLVDVQRHQAVLRHPDGRVETLALHPSTAAAVRAPATPPRPQAAPR